MRAIKIIKILLQSILSFLLIYSGGFIDPTKITVNNSLPFPFNNSQVWFDIYQNWVYPKRLLVPIIFVIIILGIEIISFYVEEKFIKRSKLKEVLNHILHADFLNDITNSRITVFKKYSGVRSIMKFCWLCLIKNFNHHKRKGLLKYYIRCFPNPFRRYLFIYSRKGKPHENGSSTHFLVPREEKEVVGIMTECVLKENYDYLHLDSIEDIDLDKYKNYEDLKGTRDKGRIVKYMEKGKIKRYEDLKKIHRPATNIATTPIYKNNKLWGTVIIDNNEGNDIFKDKEGIITPFFNVVQELI